MGLTRVGCDKCKRSLWISSDRFDRNTKVYCSRKSCKKLRDNPLSRDGMQGGK